MDRPLTLTLDTDRLVLTALTRTALNAWLNQDARVLREATGAEFAEPVQVPPLFGEDLPMFRDRMTETPDELGWWVWLVHRREDDRAVGVCGLGGRPLDGSTMLGYSVYPSFEGRGYATEASLALIGWVFMQPGAQRVVATVPVGHAASSSVALKLGMAAVGRDSDPTVGEWVVYQVDRD